MKHRIRLLLLGLATIATTGIAGAQNAEPELLDPVEIMQLVESSKHHYAVYPGGSGSDLDRPWETLFPDAIDPIEPVRVAIDADGERALERYPTDRTLASVSNDAEKAFAAGDYLGARKHYERMIELDRKFYIPYGYMGDTYIAEGNAATALAYYDTAAALNPDHYQPHYYRASALMRLGRRDESRREFIKALARNPRHGNSLRLLNDWSDELGVKVAESLVTPKSVARLIGDSVRVTVSEEGGAHWMIYGLAKGMWLIEEDHRLKLTGQKERMAWSTTEERECIAALLTMYAALREKNEIDRDRELDLLIKIAREGYLGELLVYEFGSRVSPQIVMAQSDEFKARMEEFVERYIVVSAK